MNKTEPMSYDEFLEEYPQYEETVEERAAIMEFCGLLTRELAEYKAVKRMLVKIEEKKNE